MTSRERLVQLLAGDFAAVHVEPGEDGPGSGWLGRQGAAVALTTNLAATTGQPDVATAQGDPQTANSADLMTETGTASLSTLTDSLALALAGRGSSKAVMVGVPGFEPTASPYPQ